MRFGPAKLLLAHLFVGHRPDHVGAGHEHVARLPRHDREVGDRRRIDSATGTGAENRGDLGDDSRSGRVPVENLSVAAERSHSLLDAGTSGIVEADDRCSLPQRQIHDLADLAGAGFAKRSAKHGEVLSEQIDETPVHAGETGDDSVSRVAVSVEPEAVPPMFHEPPGLFERAGVGKGLDSLPGGQQAGFAPPGHPLFSSRRPAVPIPLLQPGNRGSGTHSGSLPGGRHDLRKPVTIPSLSETAPARYRSEDDG